MKHKAVYFIAAFGCFMDTKVNTFTPRRQMIQENQILKILPQAKKDQIKKLIIFHQELLRFKALILTKKNPEKQSGRLIKDSLVSCSLLLEKTSYQKMIDVGSGAGFPGLVLAVLSKKDFQIELIEPSQKRAEFLNHCAVRLNIQNKVTVKNQVFGPTDKKAILFKAFLPLKETLKQAKKYLVEGACTYHFKSRSWKEEWRQLSAGEKNSWVLKILTDYLFEGQKRFILEIKKIR